MQTTHFSYFHPGYPRSNSGGQIAFYQPFFDRFLLVVPQEVEVVTTISILANIRYPILAMHVSNAQGYSHTLLDNHCCDNWTTVLDNRYKGKIYENDRATLIIQQPQRLEPARKLCQEYEAFSIENEKLWMQLIWFWQEFLHFVQSYRNPYQPVTDFVDNNLMTDATRPYYRKQIADFAKAVNLVLAVEIDCTLADEIIRNHIHGIKWLHDVLDGWASERYNTNIQ